jgi:hypothetical protein
MTDRICPNCKYEFKFPSLLKVHFKKSYHCLLNEEEIAKYFNKHNNVNKCNKCNKKFNNRQAYLRHQRETKCGKSQNKENRISNTIPNAVPNAIPNSTSNSIHNSIHNAIPNVTTSNNNQNLDIVDILTKLPPDLALKFLELLSVKHNTNNSSNTNNTTNNNINNTTNNTTNNLIQNNTIQNNTIQNNTIQNNNLIQNNTNNITIQHISPFGFEDVRKIPIIEMKRILKSGLNSGILIIKTIYSQIENKNFYKPNMGKSDIACLNDSYDLTIYKGNQFADVLFDRCITLLHHMLYLCKTELSTLEIQLIYDNIEYIETTMRTEIYEKKLQNIIESEVRNNNANNKSSISKYVKHIKKSPEIKTNATNVLKNIKQLSNKVNKDLQISISDEDFNDALGDPQLYFSLTKDEHNYEFQMKQYQDTKFYSYWQNRLKEEKDYIENKEDKTIGDIVNIYKREEFIKMKLDVVGDRHKTLQHGETINLDVKSDHYTSKPNDGIDLYIDNDNDDSE